MERRLPDIYHDLRAAHPTLAASTALAWARSTLAVDETMRRISWSSYMDPGPTYLRPLLIGRLGEVEVLVYIDGEIYEWGDVEPSERHRADLEVIGVAARAAGDADPGYDNAIWGVGYTDHDTQRNAVQAALDYGLIDAVRVELSERERLTGFVETVA
jgi:hypothetical protein